ncbi:hypothetical protein A2U01_0109918, partial [Trifolium medium]|nr:hypothetical protein [Trifolium medium]
ALVRGPKLLLDAKMFTTGVLLWNGFNSRARNATALLPARTSAHGQTRPVFEPKSGKPRA